MFAHGVSVSATFADVFGYSLFASYLVNFVEFCFSSYRQMVDLTADRVRREVGKVDILINNVRLHICLCLSLFVNVALALIHVLFTFLSLILQNTRLESCREKEFSI